MVAFIGSTLRGKISGKNFNELIGDHRNLSDFSVKVLCYTVPINCSYNGSIQEIENLFHNLLQKMTYTILHNKLLHNCFYIIHIGPVHSDIHVAHCCWLLVEFANPTCLLSIEKFPCQQLIVRDLHTLCA